MASKPRLKSPPVKAQPEIATVRSVANGRWSYALASVVLLIPCFWQSRIQAGDLGSHLYNAWLAGLIEAGKAPGLTIVRQTNNILFDLLLKRLFSWVGPDLAQRIAVSLAVVILAWGAFALIRQVTGRPPWAFFPVIAMITYGWTYHTGLFNFLISLGLCFWALSALWKPGVRGAILAAALLIVAYTAHPLPIAWTAAVVVYAAIGRRLGERARLLLLLGALAIEAAGVALLRAVSTTVWVPIHQYRAAVAADQVWVYDDKYLAISAALLVFWGVLLFLRIRANGARDLFCSLDFGICLLTAAGILMIPTWISLPGWGRPLVFVSDRMSLALGVCLCAVVGSQTVRPYLRYGIVAAALLYFGFLYADESYLNGIETRVETLLAKLPPGQRVAPGVEEKFRITTFAHFIDRVCVERCIAYANYEPSSGQFRVRVSGVSPLVVSDPRDVDGFGTGSYQVKDQDLPVYQVVFDNSGALAIRSLPAGQAAGITAWR